MVNYFGYLAPIFETQKLTVRQLLEKHNLHLRKAMLYHG